MTDAPQGRATHALQGRTHEVRILSRALEALTKGRGGVCVVTGPSGIGKTRLLGELAMRARRSGVTVAQRTADELDGEAPLSSLLAALRGGERPIVTPADLDRLLGGSVQRLWVIEQLRRTLQQRARSQPLLVLIDDVQLADPLTLLAIRSLVPALDASPVLWLLGRHPVPSTPSLDRLTATLRALGAAIVPLQPLDGEALSALALDVLGSPLDGDVELALERSGGVPSVALDLLHHHELRRSQPLNVAAAPSHLHRRLRSQLRGVSPGSRQLLEVASVYPHGFAVEDVAAVLHWPVTRVLPHVEEALRAGILEEHGTSLAFRLEVVREATCATLPSGVRQALEHEAARLRRPSAAAVNGTAVRMNGHSAPLPLDGADGAGPDALAGWDRLTQAELRVAGLVAQGLTNRGVAERLFLSQHTVDSHLKHVFAKLGIRSRVQLTRTVLAHEEADARASVIR